MLGSDVLCATSTNNPHHIIIWVTTSILNVFGFWPFPHYLELGLQC